MLGRYLRAMTSHGVAWLTGGLFAALLFLGLGLKLFDLPPLGYALLGILAAWVASFRAWRDEASRADGLDTELKAERARAAEEIIPTVSDPAYWVLLAEQRHGLRREAVNPAHTGGTLNAIWIGEEPVLHHTSTWIYEAADDAVKRDLLSFNTKLGGGGVYRPTQTGEKVLRVEKARKRPTPEAPGTLHDARSGQPFTVEL